MQKWFKILIVPFLVLFLCAGTAVAENITINDGRSDGTYWNGPLENDEVEPGMQPGQQWDLEAFIFENTTLSIGGGFDFMDGVSGYPAYSSGDIFLDIGLDAIYGNAADGAATPLMGYEYVIDIDWAHNGYEIISLTNDDNAPIVLNDVLEAQNRPYSNPWTYESGGTYVESGSFEFFDFRDHPAFDYYITGFDLSFLGVGQDFLAHFTMGCGNDNLMGQGVTAPVPEPATMLLLGTGLIGLAGVGRKKLFKK